MAWSKTFLKTELQVAKDSLCVWTIDPFSSLRGKYRRHSHPSKSENYCKFCPTPPICQYNLKFNLRGTHKHRSFYLLLKRWFFHHRLSHNWKHQWLRKWLYLRGFHRAEGHSLIKTRQRIYLLRRLRWLERTLLLCFKGVTLTFRKFHRVVNAWVAWTLTVAQEKIYLLCSILL